MKNELKVIVLLFSVVLSQNRDMPLKSWPLDDYQISSQRYITNADGSVGMYVNIWGAVGNPSRHQVYDGIDFATLLSIVGGPMKGANLKQVRIYREIPEADGTLIYHIDLSEFIKTGDRSNFIKINPNDTIIIPQKLSSYIGSY